MVQVSLFGDTFRQFLLPGDFVNFDFPSSAEQASSSDECPQFGDMVHCFVQVQSSILQYLRCIDLPIFPFYLVGIPRSQPSSLPAAKRLIFADTNHHSCLRKENERGKKRGNHGKECRTRSLRDGQPPSFLLLVELNGQRAVIRTCLQTKNKQTPMSAPFTSTTIPLYFHLLLSSAKSWCSVDSCKARVSFPWTADSSDIYPKSPCILACCFSLGFRENAT